jgi:hypothetical protein
VKRAFVTAALLCMCAPALAVSHVFLVQNSGWMEPFYSDPASQYKPLVTELVSAVAQPGDLMVLAAFNQGLPGAPSPKALLSLKFEPKSGREQVAGALANLAVARKPGSNAFADTDLSEAVSAAVDTALAGKPGLVWLLTNNRNSPNNDQETARRNREFYELIHSGGKITRALAFPLKMPVQGEHYKANGLMLYVFGAGAQGASELKALVGRGALAKVITEPAARLKPLDEDTVRLVPRKVTNAPGVSFSMQRNLLRADVNADTRAPTADIEWELENTIYPYTIADATISARSQLAGEDRPIRLNDARISDLAPGKSAPLSSLMQLPIKQLPGIWSMEAIGSAGSAHIMPGQIALQLSGQRLTLSQAFRERMAALFPGDPLPDVFTPPARIKRSTVVLPIEVRVHFGLTPLVALIGGVLALIGALASAALALARPRKALVTVEDELRTMHARAGTTRPIFDKAGNKVAQLKTTVFGHQLIDLREGAQVRLGR